MAKRVRVECYSGHKADERPRCFYLGERRYEVKEVLDRWRSPEGDFFRVRAEDGGVYTLGHPRNIPGDVWTLELSRRARQSD
jgi:hypothetical protein